jgi:pimeloyl-ACP methyl ester carboxylesterase
MNPEDLVRTLQSSLDTLAADGIDCRPTIFLLPGLDGDEPRLAAFRAALSDQMHFVLIDYPDWPEMVEHGRSFDIMVEHAISQIIAAVPTGDLLLVGYSYGGDVAFAAASRLVEVGRTVRFLGILDTDLQHVAEEAEHFRDQHAMADRRAEILNRPHGALGMALRFLLAKCARDLVGLERALRYNCWGGRPPTASMCQNEVV